MKRDLNLISIEGCAALPDFYTDADGMVRVDRRTPRGRAFRADYRQLQRWFVIMAVALLVVAFGARWGYERKAAEVERLKSPALLTAIDRGCTEYAEIPAWDTLITEWCHWTVTKL